LGADTLACAKILSSLLSISRKYTTLSSEARNIYEVGLMMFLWITLFSKNVKGKGEMPLELKEDATNAFHNTIWGHKIKFLQVFRGSRRKLLHSYCMNIL
jgi:hypothetical protein